MSYIRSAARLSPSLEIALAGRRVRSGPLGKPCHPHLHVSSSRQNAPTVRTRGLCRSPEPGDSPAKKRWDGTVTRGVNCVHTRNRRRGEAVLVGPDLRIISDNGFGDGPADRQTEIVRVPETSPISRLAHITRPGSDRIIASTGFDPLELMRRGGRETNVSAHPLAPAVGSTKRVWTAMQKGAKRSMQESDEKRSRNCPLVRSPCSAGVSPRRVVALLTDGADAADGWGCGVVAVSPPLACLRPASRRRRRRRRPVLQVGDCRGSGTPGRHGRDGRRWPSSPSSGIVSATVFFGR